MPRTLVGLFIAASVLVGPTSGYARGVQFGSSRPSSFIHWDIAGTGFLSRHIGFKPLAATRVVFEPVDDPYVQIMFFPPYPCYVAPL